MGLRQAADRVEPALPVMSEYCAGVVSGDAVPDGMSASVFFHAVPYLVATGGAAYMMVERQLMLSAQEEPFTLPPHKRYGTHI